MQSRRIQPSTKILRFSVLERHLTQDVDDELRAFSGVTLEEAFRNLLPGQTVVLENRSYTFRRRLTIDVSDVALLGDAGGRTVIICPSDDSAVLIRFDDSDTHSVTLLDSWCCS